jgi:predicted 2-oxoglutarate/Fe(II)-dependent dioxygenase YbiX
MRTLQKFDFLPDFFIENTLKKTHSASFAGERWLLFIFKDINSIDLFINRIDITEKKVNFLMDKVFFATFEEIELSKYQIVHRICDSNLREVFFENYVSCSGILSLEMDRNLKIMERHDFEVNDFGEKLAVGLDFLKESKTDDGPNLVPVLRVPKVFDEKFCQFLVDHFTNSQEQIQGKIGSSPELKENFKKSTHVNVDPLLANTIDNKLIFSLLPAIERVFDKRISHRVAYKIASYKSTDQGFFTAHRDNQDPGMAFRRIGMSISLNDDWEGGGISFPEYSSEKFKLSVGDALIWPASLLHQVSPLNNGNRFVLISFLYDSEGAVLRRSLMENTEVLNGKYKDSIDESLIKLYNDFSPVSRFNATYDAYEI